MRPMLRDLGQPVVAIGLGVGVLALFLLIGRFPVGPALGALANGAFGSTDNFLSAVLVRATPLIILGLAFAVGGRAGAINIGMEGQFAAGAVCATWIGVRSAGLPPWVAITGVLIGGAAGGAIWVLGPALLKLRYRVSEVISTLLLNFVATAVVSYLVVGPMQEPARIYPQSAPVVAGAHLPKLVAGTRLHAGFVIAIVLALTLHVLLRKSRWGFRTIAAGLGARATEISGRVSAGRIAAGALLWSGALAGLGGAAEVSGVSFALYQNLSPGYGFTAIAVALLGRMQPAGIVLAGVLFGAIDAGAAAMQRDAGIPASAAQVVEAVVILAMLVGSRRRQ